MVLEVTEQQEDNKSDWLIDMLEDLADNPQDFSISNLTKEIRRRCSNEKITMEQLMAATDV